MLKFRFPLVFTVLSIAFFGHLQTALATDEDPIERLYNEHGIRFSDEYPCTVKWISNEPCKSFVLSEVRIDSEAYYAGLRKGHVSGLFPGYTKRITKTKSQYAEDVLYSISVKRFSAVRYCEFSKMLAKYESGGTPEEVSCGHKNPNSKVTMLGRATAESHIGIKLDDDGVVTSLIVPSPASVGGIQIGDQLLYGPKPPRDLEITLTMLNQLFVNVVNKGHGEFFLRGGKTIEVNMPLVRMGQTVDPRLAQTELTSSEATVFDELPDAIRPFLTAIYGGRFERAEMEKKVFYLKAYSLTLGAQLGETPIGGALNANYDSAVDATRFAPLVAQYGLVKLNTVGNCGNPVTTIPYTETVVRTLSDGYGFVWSESVVSKTSKSFDIDARFAPFVVRSELVSPRPMWSAGIRYFISAAGGCESAILNQFEDNFLAYQKY
ncbi:MAG: hypothetical protein RDA78_02945 [Roseibium sp.]|uniref:hypothetical protein n=1 Tax=Roseibium sp. TaxID=1936156 RepID=UPI003D9C0A35